MMRFPLTVSVAFVLALALVGCQGGVVDTGPLDSVAPQPEPATDDETDVPDDDTDVPDDTAVPDDTSPDPDVAPEPTDEQTSDAPDPQPANNDDAKVKMTSIRLYFLAPGGSTPARADPFLVSVHRDIPSTPRIALATLRELVDGPSGADRALISGISTAVPDETLVLDVAVSGGLATVNLSREFESGGGSLSMFARLAQVTYTVTQFPTVDRVQFQLDGRPVTVFSGEGIVLDQPVSRDDYLDLLPTVFVDSPAAGATVTGGRLRVVGMAAVFEATFQYRLEAADGTVLAERFAMTDNGVGWGAFDFTINYDVAKAQQGRLTVWEFSAKDGSVQARRVTPVTLVP